MKTFRRIGAILMLMMLVVLTPVQGVLAKTTKAKDAPLKDVRKAVEAEGQWETNSKGVRFLTASGKYIKSSWIMVKKRSIIFFRRPDEWPEVCTIQK